MLKDGEGNYYNITHLAGDVDGNGVLEDIDAQWIAAYLVGETPDGFEVVNADANMDSRIDVADVVTVRRIVKGVPLGTESLTATLYSSNATVKAGGSRKVTVWVNMSRATTAYQADIILSPGLSIKAESIAFGTKVNSASHSAHALPMENGTRLIVYASGNENFSATTGTALTFTLVGANDFAGGTYQIQNQRFVAADGVLCTPEDVSYDIALSKTLVTSILLEPNDIEMIAGQDTTLSIIILPETATVKELNWLTSDANVATVSDGIISAVAEGTATITAQSTDGSNKQTTALVTVYRDADGIASPLWETEEGAIYTINGTRLDRISKTGIYIVNGKKRLIKVK